MRRLIAYLSACVLIATPITMATDANASPTTSGAGSGDIDHSFTCKPLKELPARYLDAAGNTAPALTVGAGLVRRFQLGASVVPEKVPPVGWNPLIAAPDELARWGLPARPSDLATQKKWHTKMVQWNHRPHGTSALCQTNRSSSWSTSGNWSGLINAAPEGNVYNHAYGGWGQPGFVAGCPHASAHSIWSGLGGRTENSGLLQIGTEASASTIDGSFAFWEAISKYKRHDTHEIKLEDYDSEPGWINNADVQVAHINGALKVTLSIYESSGKTPQVTIGPMRYIDGANIASYFDGSSAEYIDERTTNLGLDHPVDGRYYYLRQPTPTDITDWITSTNGEDSDLLPHVFVDMQRPSPSNKILETASGFLQYGNFDDTWQACA